MLQLVINLKIDFLKIAKIRLIRFCVGLLKYCVSFNWNLAILVLKSVYASYINCISSPLPNLRFLESVEVEKWQFCYARAHSFVSSFRW